MSINDNKVILQDIKTGESFIPERHLKFEYKGKILYVSFRDRGGDNVSLPWSQVRLRRFGY